jgi:hypothetical protein
VSGADLLSPIREYIGYRTKTDRILTTAWLLVPAASVITAVAVVAYVVYIVFLSVVTSAPGTVPPNTVAEQLGLIFALTGVNFIWSILYAVVLYRMIKRRNLHFRRQQLLFDNLLGLLLNYANGRDQAQQFQAQLGPTRQVLDEIKREETAREPAVWVIVGFFVPFVYFFVYYFLMKDIYRHERREETFLERLSLACSAIGVRLGFQRRLEPTPNRSFAVYFILDIFTAGLFWFYWFYRLITDPNRHFVTQWTIEDNLLRDLQNLPSSA